MPLIKNFTGIYVGQEPLKAVYTDDGHVLWEHPAPLPERSFNRAATVASFDTTVEGFNGGSGSTDSIGAYPGMTGTGAFTSTKTPAATSSWLVQGSTAIRARNFQAGATLAYEVYVDPSSPGTWRVQPSMANSSWSYQNGTYVELTKGVVTTVYYPIPAGMELSTGHQFVQLRFDVTGADGTTPATIQVGHIAEGSWAAPKLTWAPPSLTTPQTVQVTEADRSLSLDLNTDYIVEMPDVPLTSGYIDINGGRNVVLVGGELNLPVQVDPATGTMPSGFPSMRRGFTGATGGTFRVQASIGGAWSAPLAYDATAANVLAAIESTAGAGSLHSVTGTGIGGPWVITPAVDDPRVGRIGLDLTGLTGSAALVQSNGSSAEQTGLQVRNWTGTMHIEGLWLHGEGLGEGINVATPHPNAVLQIQNCRIEPEFYRYHPDHHHPDAIQCFNGPATLRTDRVDLICRSEGQAIIGQPRQQNWPGVLAALRDWRFRRTLFATYPDPVTGRSPSGLPIIREDDYPSSGQNQLDKWRWVMEGCYVDAPSRVGHPDTAFGEFWYYDGSGPPEGLTTGALPPGGSFTGSAGVGVGYTSPGYAEASPPRGINRLP